ncbi:DUF3800 domain-containing protein [Chelativorans sp. AA-79]|uniref:DUF3800 domain-containing protein n=1 Tax=Chelativorans sp. AA-79 TaxID=3028735 RepID=UPI0023F7ACAF|nr:DUF3800 domain-containing protein [Chelativorans sp. AA-79]WEX11680.1 DUF3800 domain-containing protein [Chelativorans sp. AA-79]
MAVICFDECKDDAAQGRPWYIVGGILIDMQNVMAVENLVSDVATDIFGSRELVRDTEFHGKEIYNAKAAFKGMPIADRIAIFDRLLEIIANDDLVRRVYAAVKTDKLKLYDRAPRYAFAHFVERAQMALRVAEMGLLIGDLDDQQSRQMVADFAQFRATGTPWDYGRPVTQIAGSVNFVRSHHSRLMQLADVYVFTVANQYAPRTGYAGDELKKVIQTRNPYAHRYKRWEPD